jgi:threonine/homoserine/homoserine lactone efflux protein
MTLPQSLLAFAAAAGLLTITPGLDTALVMQVAAVQGARRAWAAVLGICSGLLVWAAAVSLGLGALLIASRTAYEALKWAGALYLVYLGAKLILAPRHRFDLDAGAAQARPGRPFARGLLTNLLNPKVGVFYVSFLPQFVPPGAPVGAFVFALASLHAAMGLVWLGALILALRPLRRALQAPAVVRWLDRATGVVFVGFGLRLALAERR